MQSVITSDLVEAYYQCYRKAFFTIRGQPKGIRHEYDEILKQRASAIRKGYLTDIDKGGSIVRQYFDRFERCKNGLITTADLQANCDAISQNIGHGTKSHSPNEPHLAVGTYSIENGQRLNLAFAGFTIGEIKRYRPKSGFIILVSRKAKNVNLESLYPVVSSIVADLRLLIKSELSEPPELILNKNCSTCPFRHSCLREAEDTENLSLLDRMTPKLLHKYNSKGIFNVTQLSYLFRPRKHRKRMSKLPLKFNFEFQALALRTGKIYVNELPSIPDHPIELFLDIEGIPDEHFHYLIGLLIRDHNRLIEHSFWANSKNDEQSIFENCLEIITSFENAPIYHYGSYELKAFRQAHKKYQIDCLSITKRFVNLNTLIFGNLYFPSRSNRLKDIGLLVNATWDHPDASGIHSLVWRYRWENRKSEKLKQRLLSYNMNDCHAIRLLTAELRELGKTSFFREDVEFANNPKQITSDLGADIHHTLERILLFGHSEYRRKRILIRPEADVQESVTRTVGAPKGHLGYTRIIPSKPGKTIRVRRRMKCPQPYHKGQPLDPTGKDKEHTIIDLVFAKKGCRKTITKYVGEKTNCPRCRRDFLPPAISRFGMSPFGHSFKVWAVYLRIVLRLPYSAITSVFENLFSEHVAKASIFNFVRDISERYVTTEKILLKRILESPFIHIDETKLNIRGQYNYVWVLTDGKHVIFRLTQTRETTLIQNMLADYKGVLVSDFYGGYDAVKCKHQKCLVHLIRDLNDDLWKNPFNEELENFVGEFRNLLIPIFKDVEKYGLKVRHLNKHKKKVDDFFKRTVEGVDFSCELVSKYQKRFKRYRGSIFLFLHKDNIPWNNNTAERAIRHLAIQRKISGSFFQSGAIPYLRLLGIAQTCRFQDKSFLKFMLSEEKDIDRFKKSKRPKSSKHIDRQRK